MLDFFTSSILGGFLYDKVKEKSKVIASNIKEKFINVVLDDKDWELIAKKINNIPEAFRVNQDYLEAYIKNELGDVLERAKPSGDVTNSQNIGNNSNNNTQANTSGNNSPVITINTNEGDSL